MSSASEESEGDTEDVGSLKSLPGGVQAPGKTMESFEEHNLPIRMQQEDEHDASSLTTPTATVRNGQHTELMDDIPQMQEDAPLTPVMRSAVSPDESIPDDTPSIQGSLLSSPSSSLPPSYFSTSPSGKQRPTLKPFERRFSRLSPSPLPSPRVLSPGFLTPHSRQSSISSNLVQSQEGDENETPQPPWEVVRWTKLKKMSGQIFSEVGRRNFGTPSCLCVSASIVVGTSKGYILVFDYHQTLKSIVGPGTKAIECGAVTALAIASDHSTIAGGHSDGNIFTWEIARTAKPFLHIPPLNRAQLHSRTSDGHMSGTAVLHIGFLGTRHTALVSADDGGMAFSHLATRGLGAVARTVRTTRILGRYPLTDRTMEKSRKPSSVLAFAPLPLGNVEQATDSFGLTALLTPYLLVIVSTTPIAQTQYKSSRPKEVVPHSTLSGCLAWFPAVRLKNSSSSEQQVSKTKLVYCWSNILTILDIDVSVSEDKDKPADLHFQPRSRWRSDEAIVAIQWLSRSVIGVLTISQRLIILEDTSVRVTDSFDLIHKHIYHQDLYSKQLQPVVEQLDEEDASMHGVVADAFYMSFRAYKSRLFLLGFNDVSIGTLSNWADRLLALMEEGDVIAALHLATSYYNGDTDKLTVGLPEEDTARHGLVREKLLDMISASLRFTFERKSSFSDENQKIEHIKLLAPACFTACLGMGELELLFEEVYDAYEENGREILFFETLEPYILDNTVSTVPPNVLKDMITSYASTPRAKRLEEMIIRLDTQTMDLDLVTTLCRQYNLHDAVIYVWNRAISDYITPLLDLLSLVRMVMQDGTLDNTLMATYGEVTLKLFAYLASTLTGHAYPGGAAMDDDEAFKAKTDIYGFLLAGDLQEWPPGTMRVLDIRIGTQASTSFPYLQLILRVDSASFMSTLNEIFEDSFLDGDQATLGNGYISQTNTTRNASVFVPTRQYIVNVLLGVMTSRDFQAVDIIYFYMFIARNLPKYPQYINLPGSTLHKILVGLCMCPSEDLKEDCQLSTEYLLSVYHPSNVEALIELFHNAGFFRVLKSVYKNTKDYSKLLEAYLNDDEDRQDVFQCMAEHLSPSRGLTKRQLSDFHEVIVAHAADLAAIDAAQTAIVVQNHASSLQPRMIAALKPESHAQFGYLKALIEPAQVVEEQRLIEHGLPQANNELYVRLMCRFEPDRVSEFVNHMGSSDLRLDGVLAALEDSGVIDAAVMLLTRDGLVQKAMTRLIEHLKTLESALAGLIDASEQSPDAANTEEAIDDLLSAVDKYCKVGTWLCQGQTNIAKRASKTKSRKPVTEETEADLQDDELLWLDLVDATVQMTKDTSLSIASHSVAQHALSIDLAKITNGLRSSVQQIFTALLAATTSSHLNQKESSTMRHTGLKQRSPFLSILRAFLTRASRSSPSLSDLRSVLSLIFSAYTFEETILSLSSQFLEKDAFAQVDELQTLRERGWRPRGQICESCRRRAWGPGAGSIIWDKWERKDKREKARRTKTIQKGADQAPAYQGRGKGKASPVPAESDGSASDSHVEETENKKEDMGPLLVFACRHIFHRKCLDKSHGKTGERIDNTTIGGKEPSSRDRKTHYQCPLSH